MTALAILEAARHAPSGANAQPWHYVVVTGTAVKQAVAQAADLAPSFIGGIAGYEPEHLIAPTVHDLMLLGRPDVALDPLARSLRQYVERDQERVRDVEQRLTAFALQLQRGIVEYRQLLQAESRQP